MKWSDLPKKYRDLENTFSPEAKCRKCTCDVSELLSCKFLWAHTPQGHHFWYKCSQASTISELPPINN